MPQITIYYVFLESSDMQNESNSRKKEFATLLRFGLHLSFAI